MSAVISENRAFFNQLKKYYGIYTGGFISFVILLAIAEQLGMSRQWIGYWFLFATIALYAIIGIYAILMRRLDLEYNVDEGDLE